MDIKLDDLFKMALFADQLSGNRQYASDESVSKLWWWPQSEDEDTGYVFLKISTIWTHGLYVKNCDIFIILLK